MRFLCPMLNNCTGQSNERTGTLAVLRSVLHSVLLVALATVAAWAMDGPSSLASQSMAYLLAVVSRRFASVRLVPFHAGTAFLGVAALNFFFVPPRFTFSVENCGLRLHIAGTARRLRRGGAACNPPQAETAQARRRERRARECMPSRIRWRRGRRSGWRHEPGRRWEMHSATACCSCRMRRPLVAPGTEAAAD